MSKEAMKQALEALEKAQPRLAPYGEQDWIDCKAAITTLHSAIHATELREQAETQEPMACVACEGNPKGENIPCAVCGATPPAAPVQEQDSAKRSADSAESFCNQEIQDLTSLGARLALELECLLLECKDTAAVSKWWDTAHEALADWHDYLWQVSHGDNHVSPLGKD